LSDATHGHKGDVNMKATDRSEPTADEAMKNESPGDGIMEDDLTEEREITPAQRDDVARDEPQDP